MDGEWRKYRRKGYTEARPYVPGENLNGVSVSQADINKAQKGGLKGMIARCPWDVEDQWFVNTEYFMANMEEIEE